MTTDWRHPLILTGFLLLVGCGGGGGQASSPAPGGVNGTFSVAPTTLTFQADSPQAATPAGQVVTGTVTGNLSGTLYIVVVVNGEAVANVSDFVITTATTGEGTVTVNSPSMLGSGTYESVITVRACIDDPTCATGELAGSPRTVNVTYTIASQTQSDVVAPRTAIESVPGEVILRGNGLDAVTTVMIGATPGIVTNISETEIHVDYPGLTVGSYAISLNGGVVPFSGTLEVVAAPAYSAATLDFPEPLASGALRTLVYDDASRALFAAVTYAQSGDNEVLRYAHDGTDWSTPTRAVVPDLRAIAMSADGEYILAISDNAITELDAETLNVAGTYAGPFTTPFEIANYLTRDLVVANDGNAIVTTDVNGSGYTDVYFYSPVSHEFTMANPVDSLYRGTPSVSLDGSRVALIQGWLTPPPEVRQYIASTGQFEATPIDLNQGYAALSGNAERIVIAYENVVGAPSTVYDAAYTALGTVGPNARAVAVSASGERAYVFDTNGELLTFDLSVDPGGGAYTEIDAVALDPAIDLADKVELLVTQDGGTAFVAGSARILVQPVP
ncbi:MAG: hypothetical protein KJO82_01735 [Gammaproteobacteria bacterium]|nr:hypothetical protein [Gammaproteobacteria bacterium]